jgi:peptide/nickel transport system substrate-binding protein
MKKILFATLFLSAVCFQACISDARKTATDLSTIQIRTETDIDGLNPFLTNNANSVQIYQRIFLTLADFDAKTIKMEPMLIKNIPIGVPIDTGTFKNGVRYDFEILPEATWDNGQPVTGADYLFTLKSILIPKVASGIWRGYEDFIGNISVDAANPKRFTVWAKKYYILGLETLCGTPVLPEYAYDPSGILKKYKIQDLLDPKKAADFAAKDADLTKFSTDFKAPFHTRESSGVVGCGPYKLDEIVTGQRVVLSKKSNWWGDKLTNEYPLLAAFPLKIVYKPITDNAAAIKMMKDGGVDVIKNMPPAMFDELKKDPQFGSKFQFFTPQLLEFSQIVINTRRPILKDKAVRRALAELLDLDAGVQNIMRGYAVRAVGPIHPTKPYFNNTITPIKFDLESAKKRLAAAGWSDSDKNGVLDKIINGKKTELALAFRVSPKSETGKAVSLQMQENAQKVGIKIDLIQKDMTAIMEDIKSRDFDLVAMRTLQSPVFDEPYQTWHTKSDTPDGGNRSGFGAAASDKIIDEIRDTRNPERRTELYQQLQQIIFDEQPNIFLFHPTERIVVSEKWKNTVISVVKPGFFEQYFR